MKPTLELHCGNHKVLTASSFVLPTLSTEEGIALTGAWLSKMVEEAHSRMKSKKNARKEGKAKDATPAKSQTQRNSSKFRMLTTGYVSCRRNRQILIHLLAIHHFSTNPFTIEEFLRCLSVDLYLKIVGSNHIPPIFNHYPLLKQVLIYQLPKQYLEFFVFERAQETLDDEFKRLAYDNMVSSHKDYVLFQQPGDYTYQLIPRFQITWPDSSFSLYRLSHLTQAANFWKQLCLLDLTELSSPSLAALWRKRYIRLPQNKSSRVDENTSKPYVMNLLQTRSYPLNFDEFERFAAASGQEQQAVKDCLTSLKYSWRNPRVVDYCKGNMIAFQPDPSLLVDACHVTNTGDSRLMLNKLTAYSSVTPDGIFVSLPKPFKQISEIIGAHCDANDQIIREEVGNQHAYLMAFFKDYSDLFAETLASLSSSVRFGEQRDSSMIVLSTSQYFKRFSIGVVRFSLAANVGELIERLKVVSICPSALFELRVAIRFIQQVAFHVLDDAVYFLKATRFLSQKTLDGEAVKDSNFMFAKTSLRDFRLQKPYDFYTQFQHVSKMMCSPSPAISSTVATCAFFLEEPTSVSLGLVPTLGVKRDKRAAMSEYVEKSKAAERLEAKRLTLPRLGLPDIDIKGTVDSFSKKTNFGIKDYPVDILEMIQHNHMEIFVALFQVQSRLLVTARFVNGYIVQNFSRGAPMDRICFDNRLKVKQAAEVLEILVQFQYIAQVHTERAMPQFVGGEFAAPHLVRREYEGQYMLVHPHIWIRPNGYIDETTLSKLLQKTAEVVEANPGIELLDLAAQLPSVCLADLLLLISLLEADEVLYSVYRRFAPATLEREEVAAAVAPISDYTMQYELAMWMQNPDKNRTQRHCYPTDKANTNLSWVGDL